MTTFQKFCDGVVAAMPRATPREIEDIRAELTDHLLEHRDMLMDHGVEEDEAERRAVAAMGDAGEIGKAWNDKLSPFWLWAGRACMILCVVLVLELVMPFYDWADRIGDNLYVRWSEEPVGHSSSDERFAVFHTDQHDIRGEFGEHVIRIYRTELSGWEGDSYLHVDLLTYPQNPFHEALNYDILMHGLRCDGEPSYVGSGGGQYWSAAFQVPRGQESVCITLEHLGERFEAEIPLDWKGESP